MRRAFFQVYALLLISLVFQAGCTSSEDKEVLSLYKKEESSATEKSTPVFEWSFPNQDQNISHYEVSFKTEGPSLLSSPQVSYLTSGALVQDPSEQDLKDWFSVGLVNSYQLPPLVEKSFHYDTQYWFSVRAVNFEGEVLGEETVAWSVERVVLGFKNLETSKKPKLQNGLAFHFDSEIPEDFSLECYEVALGSSPGASDVRDWTDIRKEHSYQFKNLKDSLDWDRSYFVSVRAVDSQKRRTIAKSKRVSTSSSSVEFGSLTLSFDFNDERTPTVSWTSTLAPGYTLDHYELAMGTTSGGHDVLDWKNIGVVESYQVESSTDGISLSRDVDYYISIRAVDVNGDASGTATTEAFQITPTLIFHSLALEGVGLTFQAPLASWTVEKSDNYTLSHYEVGLGSSPETADLVGWIHIGSQTSYQLSGIDPILALFQEDYYLIVRAVSRDGSIVSASHVWRPRLTVTASLSAAGNSFSQTSSPRISIQVRRDPAVSGLYPPLYRVPLYELAVGTEPGSSDVVSWVDIGSSSEWLFRNISPKLSLQTDYYATLRLTDSNNSFMFFSTESWQVECRQGAVEVGGECTSQVSPFRFTELSIEGEFGENKAPQISWSAENTGPVDHYEVSVGTTSGASDVLDWTRLVSGNSPPLTLNFTPETARYISVRAVASGGDVLGTETSYLGYFEASETESQYVDESVEVVWDKALPQGVIPEFALGSFRGADAVVDWHTVLNFSGTHRHKLHNSTNGVIFNLAEGADYYVSLRFRHNNVNYLYSSKSFRFVPPQFRFTELSIKGEFGENEAPQISWSAENIDEVDHYEVSVGTASGASDVLNWTDLSSGSSPPLTLSFVSETARYVSVRAVASGGDVLGTETSYLGYFEASETESQDADESVEVVLDKALSQGVIPELALGTSLGGSDTVGWHAVSTLSGTHRHKLVSGTNGITFNLSEDTDYYVSLRFRHNDVNYLYSSKSFRFVPPFRFIALSIESEFSENKAPPISWAVEDPERVDHYEVSIGTTSGGHDILDWTRFTPVHSNPQKDFVMFLRDWTSYFSSPTLNFTPETARYISVRAVESRGEVLGTITSYLGYFEASETESQDVHESVEVVFDKVLPQGVIPEFALGTSVGSSDTVDWHTVSTFSGTHSHKLVSGTNGITFSLSEDTDYYVSMWFSHNGVHYLYISKSFRFSPPFRFTGLSIKGEFGDDKVPRISWSAENTDQVDHYEVAAGTTPGGHDILGWHRIYSGSSPMIPLGFTPETARYISIRAVTSGGDVLDTTTSYLGYFEAREDESQDADKSVEVLFDKALPLGAIPEFALGTSAGASDTVDWHTVSNFRRAQRHKLVSGTNGITFSLNEDRDYYISLRFSHNNINYLYSSKSFRFVPLFYFTGFSIEGEFGENKAPQISWSAENTNQVDHYEVAIGTVPGRNNVLNWTRLTSGSSPPLTLSFIPEVARYVSVRAVTSGGDVLGTETSYLGYFETSEDKSQYAYESVEVVFNKALPLGVIPEFALGTSLGGSDTIDWHTVLNFSRIKRHKFLSGEDAINFSLSEGIDYYISMRFRHNDVNYLYSSKSFRFVPPFRFIALSVEGEFGENKIPPIFWEAEGTDPVDHYEVSIGTTSGDHDILDWTRMALGRPPKINLSFVSETARYISVRAVTSGGEVLGTITSYLGYFEASETESQHANESVEVVFDKALPQGVIPEFALGTAVGGSDTVDWHAVSTFSGAHRHKLVSGTNGITFNLSERRDYYISMWFFHNRVHHFYVSKSFRFSPHFRFTGLSIEGEFGENKFFRVSWSAENTDPVDHYEVSVGTTSGASDVLNWLWITSGSLLRLTLDFNPEGARYVSVRAVTSGGDVLGTETSYLGYFKASEDESQDANESVEVVFDKALPLGAIPEFALGTALGGSDTVDWHTVLNFRRANRHKLVSGTNGITFNLSEDVDYYISLRFRHNGINYLYSSRSFRFVPPPFRFTGLSIEGEFGENKAPQISWSAENIDLVDHYEVAAGTVPGRNNVLNWTSLTSGSSPPLTLSFVSETARYISVRAVTSGGDVLGTETSYLGYFEASETESQDANESVEVVFDKALPLGVMPEFALGTSLGGSDTVDWHAVSTFSGTHRHKLVSGTNGITFNLSDYTDYYVSLRFRHNDVNYLYSSKSFRFVPPFRFIALSIESEFSENEAPQIFWEAESIAQLDQVDHYEVSIGTTSGGHDVLDWTRMVGHSPKITLSFVPETARYISIRAVTSGGEVLDTITSYLGYFEAREDESQDADESVEVVFDKALPRGVVPEFALGTAVGASDTVDWHAVSTFSGTHRHKLVSGTNGITFNLSEGRDYYISMWFFHNGVNHFYVSRSFRFVPSFRFTGLSIEGEFGENEAPQISWSAENTDSVDHYEVSVGTTSGASDVLGWTRLASGNSPPLTLNFTPETARYISVRAVTSGGDVLGTETSYLGYFEASGNESQTANESVEVVFDKALPLGVAPEFALGTSLGASDTVGWHTVSTFSGTHRHKLVSGTNGITFSLSEGTDYYVSLRFRHNGVDYRYSSKSFRFSLPPFRFTGLSIEGEFGENEAPQISWLAENTSQVDHYEVSVGTTSGDSDVLNWTRLASGSSPPLTLSFVSETARYISVRAVTSGSEVLGTTTSYLGYFEASETESQNSDESVEAVFDKALPEGVVPQFALGTSLGASDTVDWHTVSTFSGTHRHKLVSGTNGITFSLSEGTDYYVSLRFSHNEVDYLYSSKSFRFSLPPFRFTGLSIEGEFGENEAPQISWSAENTNQVDHYEVSVGTASGASDVLNWTRLASGSSPPLTLNFTPETARYISVRAVTSGGDVLGTETSYLGYFEASGNESQDADESVEVVFDKALPLGVVPEFALGTSVGGSDTVDWHMVLNFSSTQRHKLVSGEEAINFSLSESTDYYVSLRFSHNGINYLYSSKSFRFVPPFRFTALSIEGEFGENEAPQISWSAENTNQVDHYEVSVGTASGASDVLNWTRLASGSSPPLTLNFTPETARYISIRAVTSGGDVLGTETSYLGYFEASGNGISKF